MALLTFSDLFGEHSLEIQEVLEVQHYRYLPREENMTTTRSCDIQVSYRWSTISVASRISCISL